MADVDLPLEHVHLEPDAGPGATAGLFLLHGRGADERDLLTVARRLPGDRHVFSLRAPDELQGGHTWYELDLSAGGLHASQPDPDGFRRSLELVSECVERAAEEYDLATEEIGLLGFSQGAIMSFALLLEAPRRFGWCAGLHGYLADSHADLDPEGIEGKPVFVGAGARDQIIPEERAAIAAERFEELGCAVSFSSYDVGHGIGSEELGDLADWVGRVVGAPA